jgi:hypothetical protein
VVFAKNFGRNMLIRSANNSACATTLPESGRLVHMRGAEGALARTVYRHIRKPAALQVRSKSSLPLVGMMGMTTQETIARLLGVSTEHAQTPAQAVPSQAAALRQPATSPAPSACLPTHKP